MGKVFLIDMSALIIAILLVYFVLKPIVKAQKKEAGIQSVNELKGKASQNLEEREAIKKSADNLAQSLQEIKSKTS